MTVYNQRFGDRKGKKQLKRTTVGWDLCVQWKDGSTSWEKLSDLKECYPVQTAEYAVAQQIAEKPAFNLGVKPFLKKQNCIISLVKKRKTRYAKNTHQFGIKIPRSVDETISFDEENGNTYWQDAMAKEMKNVKCAFEILDDGQSVLIGYNFVKCHTIFSVKI